MLDTPQTIDGIINENSINFVGKDGFFWWVGEVEDNEDPMELGRVRVRVLGYYTNVQGGTTADLKTEHLPWATVLQHTSQAGNDGQGESSGQLQPGAVVMGFFMDGDSAQMPIVIGVMRVNKSTESRTVKEFAFTGEDMKASSTGTINPASNRPGDPNSIRSDNFRRPGITNNSVATVAATKTTEIGGKGSPLNVGMTPGINGSTGNPQKPRQPEKPIPAANGVGGPWKSLDYTLSYLIEDLSDTAGLLVKSGDGYLNVATGKIVFQGELLSKIHNYLGAVYTQVISAMRLSTSNLITTLETDTLLGNATGAPYALSTVIQQAVNKILSELCLIDSQLEDLIKTPLDVVTNQLDTYLSGLIDKSTFVNAGIEEVISTVICNVEKMLTSLNTVVNTASTIVEGHPDAKEVLDTWKAGNKIFSERTDLFEQEKTLTGLIGLFVQFIESNCDRPIKGGEDTVGWYPLFGVTHCTPDEYAQIQVLRGETRGKCGETVTISGGLFDSVFAEADPYLTTAKTQVNGSFELYVGTPGRQATIIKRENGTTHTSVNLNNATHQEWLAKTKIKQEHPELTEEEVDAAATESVRSAINTTTQQTAWVRSADNLPDGVIDLWSDFLKTYGVYPSNTDALLGSHIGTWEVTATTAGTYTFEVQADNEGSIKWNGATIGTTTVYQSHNVSSTFVVENVQPGTHTITGTIANVWTEKNGGLWETNPAALAWVLKDPSGTVIKTSLDAFPIKTVANVQYEKSGDVGNLLADHISWAGTKTEEVHGDDCKVIDNNYVRTVQGDYHLKVTGDCHIEVGGGFFFSAQGAPKSVSKYGSTKDSKIQKHTISFGSDVDMAVNGATFEFQAANLRMAATKTSITGKEYENAAKLQKHSSLEHIISADNSIEMVTTSLYQKINMKNNPFAEKAGITTVCNGSVDYSLFPGGSPNDAIPRFTLKNTSGPVSMTCGASGYNLNVMNGAYNVMAHEGLIRMESKKGPATIAAAGAIGINAGGAISQTGTSIHLN
tara:strand:- start:38 stop:3064 length:3027 start_codon:yes stop_codon:yes gene_type:complete